MPDNAPTPMRNADPDLSVVLQVGAERDRATVCLQSLLAQDALPRMEILVLDYDLGGSPPIPGSDHPRVRLVRRPGYEPIGVSRAVAIREAKGPVVAFIEDHCVAMDGWAQGILEAHRSGWKAIGCEVHIANAGIGISDSITIMNYWPWLPPAREGVHDMVAGHNVAYDRAALLELRQPLEVLLRCDPVLHWFLKREGVDLYLASKVRIAHNNETELSAIMLGYFHWNRVFAVTRAELFEWTLAKKALWILLAPMIPVSRILKQSVHFLRERPDLLLAFLRSLPVQGLAHVAAAAGQVAGLGFGLGNSETGFLIYELNQFRRRA